MSKFKFYDDDWYNETSHKKNYERERRDRVKNKQKQREDWSRENGT